MIPEQALAVQGQQPIPTPITTMSLSTYPAGLTAREVEVLSLRERISMEAAALALIGTTFAISQHIFPWYTTALMLWIATLAGRLWRGKRRSGKGIASAMAWYFTFAVLLGYFPGNSLDWRIYYALVYDVVLFGLAVAVVAELRKVRAIPAYRAPGREGRGGGDQGLCR